MNMNVFKLSLLLILCFGLLFSSAAVQTTSSDSDWTIVDGILMGAKYNDTSLVYKDPDNKQEIIHVKASDFLFVYKDRVSTKYEGDTGLEYSMFVDTLTGYYYHVDKSLTRGIAYATKRKFDIKDFSLKRMCYPGDKFYSIFFNNITLDNGTVIESLTISEELTNEQKKYFDNYDEQLYRYYEDKKVQELEDANDYLDAIDSETRIQNKINSKKGGSYYGYSSKGGYMYGRYY